jgi:membrane-associated phospholipid phosphatase
MMGASGPFAALLFVWGYAALPFIIIMVFIGWARIKLECHNLSQVIAGALIAFLSTYAQIYLITKYFGYA